MGWDQPAVSAPLVVHPTDLRSLVDASLDAVLVADGRGQVRFLNPAAAQLLGRPVGELVGRSLDFSPDQTKTDYQRPDGTQVTLSLRWGQLLWEGNLAWAAFIRDVWPQPPADGPQSDPDLERRAVQAELRNEQLSDETARLGIELATLRERLSSAEEVLQAKEEAYSQLQAQADFLERRAEQAEERAKTAEDSALDGWVQADERARKAEDRVGELQDQIVRLDQELELSKRREAELRAEHEAGPPELVELENRAQKAETELARQLERLAALEGEVQALREKAEARDREGAEARVADLEQRNQELEARALQAEKAGEAYLAEARRLEEAGKAQELALKQALHEATVQAHETRRLAFEDRLTALPNFNILQQFLDYTVGMVARGEGSAALLVLDMDRFRMVNQTMGHAAGDDLLCQLAERFKAHIRPSDVFGRRREDEFLVVVVQENGEGVETDRAATAQIANSLATRLLGVLAEPLHTHGMTVNLSASLGITMFGAPGETSQQVLEQAYAALDRARELGRARLHFYSADLQERARKRVQMVPRLRQALEAQEFMLLYQPIVDLKAGKIAGLEAFLRWNDPQLGLLEPADFLWAAEESGAIVPIGEWVVQEACLLSAQYKDIFVSINLSARQLMHADFPRRFMKAVERARAKPQKLVVEIAEDTSALDPDRIDAVLGELARWGVGVAIDDFGAGTSSLKRLQSAKPRFLKIDGGFVTGLPGDRQSWSITLAACQLAASLQMLSLAEGVEGAEQVACLRQIGCKLAQGRFFSPPVPAASLRELVKRTWKLG